ncbi:MAG: cytochrome b5-like heme/steroid binding domain-containing protein [bacterium]|nr:cytochrome b5-like heme/steroid binding domain-containing protein [bacterium]
MQNRIILIVVGLALIFGVGFFVYSTKQPVFIPPEEIIDQTPSPTPTPSVVVATPKPTPTPTPTPTFISTPTPSGITLSQIALHNSRSSCWSAINGNVYDLTSWIPYHPGGENTILSICGKNGSGAYNGEHGGSSKTAKILIGFKIGVLVQ